MTACMLVGATVIALGEGTFTLNWEHSVEKTRWRETWVVAPEGLTLVAAAVKGSGAGMDPGPGAHLSEGWWIWSPDNPTTPQLVLAASGETGGGWTLCADATCREIGVTASDPIVIRPCEGK